MSQKPRVVFVLSTPRAGSAWFGLVLGSHSWAAFLGEYHRFWNKDDEEGKCHLCEAKRRRGCEVLSGIENVPIQEAHSFASKCQGGRILIDISKKLEWVRPCLNLEDIDARFIHLYCNPCKFVASMQRREEEDPMAHFKRWKDQNARIEEFVKMHAVPCLHVCYDEIADAPDEHFPKIADCIGGYNFEPNALSYWAFPHHGSAGGGAASVYLRDVGYNQYKTADESWYQVRKETPVGADKRWQDELDNSLQREILNAPYSRRLLSDMHMLCSQPNRLGVIFRRLHSGLHPGGLKKNIKSLLKRKEKSKLRRP